MGTSTAPSSAARCWRNTSRSRFGDSAKRVMHRPAGLLTTRRRFQGEERVQLLCDGVSKQRDECDEVETALTNKRAGPITLKRGLQIKERVQLLCNGVSKQKNASNYFVTAFPNKRTRPITL